MTMRRSALLILTLTQLAGTACLADDASSSSSTSNSSSDKQVLEGQIKADSIALSTHLKDLAQSLHHLKRAAFDIYCETQRQDQVVAVQPDVIGPIILPAIPSPSGMLSMGTLPPRKKFLDYFMNQIGQLLPMVDSEINALALPKEMSDEGTQDLNKIRELARGMNPLATNLDKVTKGPDLKPDDIAQSAVNFQGQVKEIEKLVKSLSKEAKTEEKKADKALKDLERKKK